MAKTAEELRADAARQREQLGETVDAIGDRVSPGRIIERRTNRMRDGVERIRSSVMGTADHARGVVGDASGSAVHEVSDVVHAAGSLPRTAADSATERAAGNPLAAGAVAFGLGFLAAAVFPGTQAEQRVAAQLKDAAEPLISEAKQIGAEAAHQLQQPAQEALEHVKEVATDEAASLKEGAQQQVDDAATAGRDAVGSVRDAAATRESGSDLR